jgi:hypothetical protein
MVTYTNVSVNGGDNSALVGAGSTVNLSYDMSVAFDYITGYCPGCVVQVYIGIGGTSQTIQCDNYIGDGYSNSFNGSFTAPTTPGVYYLTQNGSLQYFCVPMSFSNMPSYAIAVIQVGDVPWTSDNCGAVTVGNNHEGCFALGSTVVTWTATDECGNTTTCTQTVTVIDTQAPVIVCPQDVTIQCDASVDPNANPSLGVATAVDNCDQDVAITYSDVYGQGEGCPQTYTITRTWTATDDSGNNTSCVQLIR